jgi:hypothetical protein
MSKLFYNQAQPKRFYVYSKESLGEVYKHYVALIEGQAWHVFPIFTNTNVQSRKKLINAYAFVVRLTHPLAYTKKLEFAVVGRSLGLAKACIHLAALKY